MIVLIYNASGTFLGELYYISQKISCSIGKKDAPCPACDITHSVKELGMKKEFKALLQEYPDLKTLHTNELDSRLKAFCSTVELPVLLLVEDEIKVVADRLKLLQCDGSVDKFKMILDGI